jgi:hypothetical protein
MERQAGKLHQLCFHVSVVRKFVVTSFGIVQVGMKMRSFYTAEASLVWRSVNTIVVKTRSQEIVRVLAMTREAELTNITLVGKRSDFPSSIKD